LMCVTLVLVAFVHVFQSTYSLSLTSFPVWAFGWCWTACLFWSAKFMSNNAQLFKHLQLDIAVPLIKPVAVFIWA
jgi:hypothetical protein